MGKVCKAPSCRKKFEPEYSTLQECCSPKCAIEWANTDKGQKQVQKAKKQETKAEIKQRRDNDLSWWLGVNAESDKNGGNTAHWLHRWIVRVRDRDQPCIMCGSFKPKGGRWNACHYRSRGAASHLRFDPDNIHKGCTHCNTMTKGDTGAIYRANLVERIGEDRVTALETENKPKKWTIEECREIRDYYRDLVKQSEAA